MANFDRKSLKNLEKLCLIQCTEEEEQTLLENIQKILQYVEQLNEIDTEEVSPCNYVLKNMPHALLREDEVGEVLSKELFLSNAPDQIGGMVRVPPVLKSST